MTRFIRAGVLLTVCTMLLTTMLATGGMAHAAQTMASGSAASTFSGAPSSLGLGFPGGFEGPLAFTDIPAFSASTLLLEIGWSAF